MRPINIFLFSLILALMLIYSTFAEAQTSFGISVYGDHGSVTINNHYPGNYRKYAPPPVVIYPQPYYRERPPVYRRYDYYPDSVIECYGNCGRYPRYDSYDPFRNHRHLMR